MREAHRLSLAALALAAIAILSGGYITSLEVVARLNQSSTSPNEWAHRVLGGAVVLLALAAGIRLPSKAASVRVAAWASAGVLALAILPAWHAAPLPPWRGVWHAVTAHLFFAGSSAVALLSSDYWNRPAEPAEIRRPFLRPLALITPPVVFVQIILGTLYRHNVTGFMPHVALAMAVALLALALSSVVLQHYRRPASLRKAAAALIGAVLLQASLGIASLVMLLLNFTATGYFLAATVAHVAVGAATLAASTILALEVWRSVPR